MPTPLQYPLELCRGLEERWLRLLEKVPPRDRYNDDDDDEEEDDQEEADGEPAVIREPDKDE